MQPLFPPQIPAPTVVVSPPAPTTALGATCGTKMRLRSESVATECDPVDCGTDSMKNTSSDPVTPLTLTLCVVLALKMVVWVSLGLLRGVQPSISSSSTPTVAPFGPQAASLTTPVWVAGSKAPSTALGLCGSVTSTPPWQVMGPAAPSKLQPGGLLAMIGIDV